MLRLVIIDDEPLARQRLRQLLSDIPNVGVCGEASSLPQAITIIEETAPDGLLLDIRMPHGDGFSLLQTLEHPPPVVFVTAHADFAVRAFEVNAVDYVLKPLRLSRLTSAIDRLRVATGQAGDSPTYQWSDRICLRTPERTIVTTAADILLLEAEGDFTRVTVSGEQPLLICQTIGSYERTLPSPPLVRLDRSIIVNLEQIETIEVSPRRGARVTIRGRAAPVELGRTALRRLREAIPDIAGDLHN